MSIILSVVRAVLVSVIYIINEAVVSFLAPVCIVSTPLPPGKTSEYTEPNW